MFLEDFTLLMKFKLITVRYIKAMIIQINNTKYKNIHIDLRMHSFYVLFKSIAIKFKRN